jgi:hypothetical protein
LLHRRHANACLLSQARSGVLKKHLPAGFVIVVLGKT